MVLSVFVFIFVFVFVFFCVFPIFLIMVHKIGGDVVARLEDGIEWSVAFWE